MTMLNPPLVLENILTDDEIDILLKHSHVNAKKAELQKLAAGNVRFALELDPVILDKINAGLGCHLQRGTKVPLTWVKGDTPAHADVDSHGQRFKSHLIYLTDNKGSFCIGADEFPIKKGCGFVFEQDTLHETRNTGDSCKLIVGPFNAGGIAVGLSPMLLSLETTPSNILEPAFYSSIYSYTANVSYSTSTITISASTNTDYYINFNDGEQCITNNSFTVTYPLQVGSNIFKIALYSKYGGVCTEPLTPFYTLSITRNSLPPPKPLYMGNMGSLFTDNALVYYKSHSLSSGGGGSGVRNCHAKQNRT